MLNLFNKFSENNQMEKNVNLNLRIEKIFIDLINLETNNS